MQGAKQKPIDFDGKSFDRDILDLPIPDGAKRLLLSLRQFGQVIEGVVDVSPSLEEIQLVVGARSRRTIQSYLHLAQSRGQRYVTIRENPGGRYSFRVHRVPIAQDADRFRMMRGNVRAAYEISPLDGGATDSGQGCNLEAQGMQSRPERDAISTAQTSPENDSHVIHVFNEDVSKRHVHARNGRYPGGWDREITPAVLRDARQVEQLYRWALNRRWLAHSEVQRRQFYRLAIYSQSAKSPGRALTHGVKHREWTGADDDQATAMMRTAEGRTPRASPAPGYQFEGPSEVDRQMREIAERFGAGGRDERR